jgi:hypothetical protein
MKISEGLSNSKNMIFNMKKLLNVGVDLTLRQRGKKKQGGRKEATQAEWAADIVDFGCQWPVFTGERLNADVYQQLFRQHASPWVQGMYRDGKICLSVDSALSYAPKTAEQMVCGIRVSVGSAAIFTRIEFAGLLYIMCFAGKSPGYASHKPGRSTSVLRRGIEPASCTIYPQNMPLIPPPQLDRH